MVAVNAVGSWHAATGLAEAARRTVAALLEVGVSVELVNVDFGAPMHHNRLPDGLRRLSSDRRHQIELCFVNVNELNALNAEWLVRQRSDSYVIGSWYWELPELSSELLANVAQVDEVWVASRFVRDAFQAHMSTPVRVMPCVVEPNALPQSGRAHFGLPEDSCLFLFSFDANSTFARKNPWAAIQAFRSAFSRDERGRVAHLVIKVLNLGKSYEARLELESTLASVSGILIEEDLTTEEMATLISIADVYVSLHRSEGFGLGLAEAMYLGRPVIATAYSGNTDFMTANNSCQVGYTVTAVNDGELRFNPSFDTVYTPGQIWASPDVSQAARWMRLLYERPGVRQRIGSAAAASIRDRYSKRTAGEVMRVRLEEIAHCLDLTPRTIK